MEVGLISYPIKRYQLWECSSGAKQA